MTGFPEAVTLEIVYILLLDLALIQILSTPNPILKPLTP